jgi:protein-serine/threonine kinase
MLGINNKRSRSAAAEDDGHDHIGYETPRSGVATPKPDLHDKRTPGIMSMFGQVRPASFSHLFTSRKHTAQEGGATIPAPSPCIAPQPQPPRDTGHDPVSEPNTPAVLHPVEPLPRNASSVEGIAPHRLPHEMVASCVAGQGPRAVVTAFHPYPTPPDSGRSSLYATPSTSSLRLSSHGGHVPTSPPRSRPSLGLCRSLSLFSRLGQAPSLLTPLPSMVTESSVPAHHISNPGDFTVPSSPTLGASDTSLATDTALPSSEFASVTQLRKLTSMVAIKSGTSTPTRALSTAAPSQAETSSSDASREVGHGSSNASAQSSTPAGTQAPAIKGKLTIKVSQGRGLRQCRDPYVVVSFQRSELQSSGPHSPPEVDDDAAVQAVAMGGLPMKHQVSDSGRPAMAIPMKSRQSSNTSLHDFQTFRNRNARHSFTNPTWDAEAIL